jgi:hypothetical protein
VRMGTQLREPEKTATEWRGTRAEWPISRPLLCSERIERAGRAGLGQRGSCVRRRCLGRGGGRGFVGRGFEVMLEPASVR